MAGDASACAALGLEPAADSATIEAAYKQLIKGHHPDRGGGDAVRAAEINRAQREIRAERNLTDPLELNDEWPVPPAASRARMVMALVLASAVGLSAITQPSLLNGASAGARFIADRARSATDADSMDKPLHVTEIDGAVQHALRLASTRDEMALASARRDRHQQLRRDRSLLQLGRCAAFGDAVVQLQDRDPLRDQGPPQRACRD